mmetsp:Transcript_1100/g.987  ORF Transcript_1100/g.987 Transcript_1100/m.987 type:complete len:161 (+) Transcript_1100:1339-1821(+)
MFKLQNDNLKKDIGELQDKLKAAQEKADALQQQPVADDDNYQDLRKESKKLKSQLDNLDSMDAQLNSLQDMMGNLIDQRRKEIEMMQEKVRDIDNEKVKSNELREAITNVIEEDEKVDQKNQEGKKGGASVSNEYVEKLESEIERLRTEIRNAKEAAEQQ